MRIWRSHPVLFAALLGAILGFADAVVIEAEGLLHGNPNAVLPMLFPASMFRTAGSETRVVQIAFILFIQLGANVLVYALLFAVPVAMIVGFLRIFGALRSRLR